LVGWLVSSSHVSRMMYAAFSLPNMALSLSPMSMIVKCVCVFFWGEDDVRGRYA
jgi:hypothetical protein